MGIPISFARVRLLLVWILLATVAFVGFGAGTPTDAQEQLATPVVTSGTLVGDAMVFEWGAIAGRAEYHIQYFYPNGHNVYDATQQTSFAVPLNGQSGEFCIEVRAVYPGLDSELSDRFCSSTDGPSPTPTPTPTGPTPNRDTKIYPTVTCLAGNGRIDLNVLNNADSPQYYSVTIGALSPRATTVASRDFWRSPVTGRPDGPIDVTVEQEGVLIFQDTLTVDCDSESPTVSSPQIRRLSVCRSGKGFVAWQFANHTGSARPYFITFDGVPNRSTTAAAYGASVRGTSGRPDGTYGYTISIDGPNGRIVLEDSTVTVQCDGDPPPVIPTVNFELRPSGCTNEGTRSYGAVIVNNGPMANFTLEATRGPTTITSKLETILAGREEGLRIDSIPVGTWALSVLSGGESTGISKQLTIEPCNAQPPLHEMNVVSIIFLPRDESNPALWDQSRRNDPIPGEYDSLGKFTGTLAQYSYIRDNITEATASTVDVLNEGSRSVRGSGRQTLNYSVVDTLEFEQFPPIGQPLGGGDFRPDYDEILEVTADNELPGADFCAYIESAQIDEVWIWTDHDTVTVPIESQMSPRAGIPYVDISNSGGGAIDNLPRCATSYVMYNFNFTRGVGEALHNHLHQIENINGYHPATPPADRDLFDWKRPAGQPTTPNGTPLNVGSWSNACGDSHWVPVDRRDPGNIFDPEYQWGNPKVVDNTCTDWNPSGTGDIERLACGLWNCVEKDYYIWWLQRLPGEQTSLFDPSSGNLLNNWLNPLGDLDTYLGNNNPRLITNIPAGD